MFAENRLIPAMVCAFVKSTNDELFIDVLLMLLTGSVNNPVIVVVFVPLSNAIFVVLLCNDVILLFAVDNPV